VLMTDDGQWSHRITSPRHHCEKTYLVTLETRWMTRLNSLPKAFSCIMKKI
jgi:16S rRNA pseudouridine516 synthase